MYYDINETLSYNCLFNFIIGSRGTGKTYGAKKRAIKQFLDKGYQFVYLRRYQDELEETAESYFNDIILNNEFPDVVIEYKNGCYFVNDQLAGYAMALTKAKSYKSISFPMVYLIIFDEFLVEETGFNRYLKNEVEIFLGFYMSIDRYRGATVFFLANSTTMINPYTLYFDLHLPYGSKITRKDDILLQLVENKDFIESRKQTRFGKLIQGTKFADYAIDNKFMYDSKTFIERKSDKAEYYFTMVYKGEQYGVWVDYSNSKMYVSQNVDPSCYVVYSLTTDDHKPNTIFFKNVKKSPLFKKFIEYYKLGCVYFENQKLKNIGYEIIKMSM